MRAAALAITSLAAKSVQGCVVPCFAKPEGVLRVGPRRNLASLRGTSSGMASLLTISTLSS